MAGFSRIWITLNMKKKMPQAYPRHIVPGETWQRRKKTKDYYTIAARYSALTMDSLWIVMPRNTSLNPICTMEKKLKNQTCSLERKKAKIKTY